MTEAQNTGEVFYQRAVRRIYVNVVWLSIAGTVVAVWFVGWAWGMGFLTGATASALNFRWLHHLAEAIGPGGKKPRKRLGVFLSLRYLLFGVVGYVMIKYFQVDILAALVGLFVAVAAVLVEILYELIYART